MVNLNIALGKICEIRENQFPFFQFFWTNAHVRMFVHT
jgi:hypothetical protein